MRRPRSPAPSRRSASVGSRRDRHRHERYGAGRRRRSATADGCCAGRRCVHADLTTPAPSRGKIAIIDRGDLRLHRQGAQRAGRTAPSPSIVGNNVAWRSAPGRRPRRSQSTSRRVHGAPRPTATRSRPDSRRRQRDDRSTERHGQLRALADGRGRPAAASGALRDMWNPHVLSATPARSRTRSITARRRTAGGVHINSGVDNHAFALLVDGGTYNGQTVTAIGLTKAAHIYFRAKTRIPGPSDDFPDHADALEQSCADLIGVRTRSRSRLAHRPARSSPRRTAPGGKMPSPR